MGILKSIYYSCFLILIAANAAAQNTETAITAETKLPAYPIDSSAKLMIRNILIKGNKKTRDYLIMREIQFKPGDSIIIGTLNDALQMARQQVYNTTLFHEVNIDLKIISAYDIDVTVTVKERWYIFPLLQFQVVDRSINEWLVKYKADLSRVNYGVKFVHYNFSGRRDPFRLFLINGYTKNIAFSYSQPYSNSALTQGFGIGGGFSQNREIAYKTSPENKILFYKTKDFVSKNINVNLSMRLQKGILGRHFFNLAYTRLTVSDSIISTLYNPNYFNINKTTNGLLDLSYSYQYTNVNNSVYPLKGKTGHLTLSKRGLGFSGGINLLTLEGSYNKFWTHPNKWYTSLQFIGHIKLPFDQPYINQRAIGYGDANLRGLEFYVIDGVAFGILKSTIKKKLFSFSVPMPFKSKLIPGLPFSVFAKTFADAGVAYNKRKYDTYLNNRLLYTGGFGIDILTLYDINLKIQYSFNQMKQGVFFFESR